MNFNNSYQRKKFKADQKKQAEVYRKSGMTEAAIHEMYRFDLEIWLSERRRIEHAVHVHEMTRYDPRTGEPHYMDMDELPARAPIEPTALNDWTQEIESEELYRALKGMPSDYINIISLLLRGHSQAEIGRMMGVARTAINNKVERIRKILEKFQ